MAKCILLQYLEKFRISMSTKKHTTSAGTRILEAKSQYISLQKRKMYFFVHGTSLAAVTHKVWIVFKKRSSADFNWNKSVCNHVIAVNAPKKGYLDLALCKNRIFSEII